MPVSGRRFARILEGHGWVLLRVYGATALKLGLLRSLLKTAGLSKEGLD